MIIDKEKDKIKYLFKYFTNLNKIYLYRGCLRIQSKPNTIGLDLFICWTALLCSVLTIKN